MQKPNVSSKGHETSAAVTSQRAAGPQTQNKEMGNPGQAEVPVVPIEAFAEQNRRRQSWSYMGLCHLGEARQNGAAQGKQKQKKRASVEEFYAQSENPMVFIETKSLALKRFGQKPPGPGSAFSIPVSTTFLGSESMQGAGAIAQMNELEHRVEMVTVILLDDSTSLFVHVLAVKAPASKVDGCSTCVRGNRKTFVPGSVSGQVLRFRYVLARWALVVMGCNACHIFEYTVQSLPPSGAGTRKAVVQRPTDQRPTSAASPSCWEHVR